MPALIAHRGDPHRYPENTLAGIEAAIAAGAHHVEVDVQLSADGKPIIFHDDGLERLCGAAGRITALDLAAIRGLRVGGEPLPVLADLAWLLQGHPGVHAFVELKQESIDVAGEAAVLGAVTSVLAPVREQCTLISFNAAVLSLALGQGWAAGWVTDAWPAALPDGLQQGMCVWFCDVKALPAAGPVNPFTVPLAVYALSDPALARRLAERGAAYVETDDIGPMRQALPAWT